MVIENICFLLNNFIKCSAYENIVFCWVMHEQSIMKKYSIIAICRGKADSLDSSNNKSEIFGKGFGIAFKMPGS